MYRLAAEGMLDQKILEIQRFITHLFISVGCVMIVFSHEIVQVLTGPLFHESYKIMALLTVALVLRGLTIPVSTYTIAVHKKRDTYR